MNRKNCIVHFCFDKQSNPNHQFCDQHYKDEIEGYLGKCVSRGCSNIINRDLYKQCLNCSDPIK